MGNNSTTTYVLTLSKVFPITHPCKGEPTGFKDKFLNAINCNKDGELNMLHSIRVNYDLWKERFEQINAGKACLSIRQWEGKPYASKQVEIAKLTKEDGIGLQKLSFCECAPLTFIDDEPKFTSKMDYTMVANNDGLSLRDWEQWFKGCDTSKPLAIIHFTSFRY